MFNDLEEFNDNIKIFTNIDFIKEKYNNDYFEFVEEFNESEISILDSSYKFENNSSLKINIDEFKSNVDAFIDKDNIIAYLDLIEKFDFEICGIKMADITDVMKVTKGTLEKYIKLELNKNSNIDDMIDKFKELEDENINKDINGSAIIFFYLDNYLILDEFIKKFDSLYKNLNVVILKAEKIDIKNNEYIEVFIFKEEGEDE